LSLILILLFSSCSEKRTICSSQESVIDARLDYNCTEIINYLKNNNWRKHSFENTYVIENSFRVFDKFMTKRKACKLTFSVEDIISLFGKPNSTPVHYIFF